MADFRIDELHLIENNGKYSLTGICNKWGAQNNASLTGRITSFNNLRFDARGLDPTEKITISAEDDIDFSSFSDTTTDTFEFYFDTLFPSLTRKAGIVIKHTNYPPPYRGHGFDKTFEDFLLQFKVTEAHFERNQITGMFAIQIKATLNNPVKEYSVDSTCVPTVIGRSITNISDILTLRVKEWPQGSGNGTPTLEFPTFNSNVSIDLTNFDQGFPITILIKDNPWLETINRKIMNVFIV